MTKLPPVYGKARYGVAIYTSANTPSGRKSMKHHLRVFLGFNNSPDAKLVETTGNIITGLTGNAAYLTPPVTLVALAALLKAFTDAMNAMAQGGTVATSAKNDARENLIAALRQLAAYVQITCNDDLTALLSSGFEAVSAPSAPAPLGTPVITGITNGLATGVLLIVVTALANAKCYEVRFATIINQLVGPWLSGGMFTNSRAMALGGLVAGTNYAVEVRAIGGSTGYSAWSAGSNRMSL